MARSIDDFFDARYYLTRYTDVAAAGVDPLEHYKRHGWRESRWPTPWFNPKEYRQRVPGLVGEEIDPFAHFIDSGDFADAREAYQIAVRVERPEEPKNATTERVSGRSIDPFFDAAFYVKRYSDVAAAGVNPLQHYKNHGWREGRWPTPWFNPKEYRLQFPNLVGKELDPFAHFIGSGNFEDAQKAYDSAVKVKQPVEPKGEVGGKGARRSIDAFFDATFYLKRYGDVAAAGVDPLQHYKNHGWREARWPTPWFNPKEYRLQFPDLVGKDVDPFAHFIGSGDFEDARKAYSSAVKVKQAAEPKGEVASKTIKRSIDAFFDAPFYLKRYADVAMAGADPLQHYKKHGWREGRWPTAWFNPKEYHLRFPGAVGKEVDPFVHFINSGDFDDAREAYNLAVEVEPPTEPKTLLPGKARVAGRAVVYELSPPSAEDIEVTEPHFDASFYMSTYPDVERSLVDPLIHFLTIGWLEGRDPSPDFSVRMYLRDYPDVRRARINPFVHYCRKGRNQPWRRAVGVAEAAVLEKFSTDDRIAQMVREAIKLEPMVGLPDALRTVNIPTRTLKAHSAAWRSLRVALAGKSYEFVVLIPHIRMSGAARVSSVFTRALSEVVGEKRILVVCTDSSELEFQHWFPEKFDLFDGSVIFQSVEAGLRTQLLYDLLRGVGARAVFNVNSRLAWDAMEVYGRQLSQEFRVYSYLFTWEETASGVRVGYPIQWLRNTSDWHHVIFTDSKMLADDVRTRFGYDDGRCAVIPLHTPAESRELAVTRAGRERRRVFLWSGRFDRQKRTDLLIAVAKACPQVEFHIYGKSVVDKAGLDPKDLPSNCTLKGTYKDLSEVFGEENYAGFLYTSQWDGIPTILLDIGAVGLPIVASDVGGVSEVVTAETGWLVSPFGSVNAYVAAIKQIIDNPTEAASRAAAMKRHLSDQFSEDAYREAIREALGRHGL